MQLYFLKEDKSHWCSLHGSAGVELLEVAKLIQEKGYHTIGYLEYQKYNWGLKSKKETKLGDYQL